jgi:hypothetical protein
MLLILLLASSGTVLQRSWIGPLCNTKKLSCVIQMYYIWRRVDRTTDEIQAKRRLE